MASGLKIQCPASIDRGQYNVQPIVYYDGIQQTSIAFERLLKP